MRGDEVVASHHIGDLEHLATWQSFRQAVEHLPALYGVTPEIVAHDLHPEYLSTKFALDLDLPSVAVQHHHAHVASCMVEHGRREPVVALAFDGLGYGPDGTLWGGEVLVADYAGYERAAHLRPVPMPGGSAAIREPWRMALVWARAAGRSDPDELGLVPAGLDATAVAAVAVDAVADLVDRGGGRATTSVGRLFDAVAVLLGCRARVTYEAQAAIELEALAARSIVTTRRASPTTCSSPAASSTPRRSSIASCTSAHAGFRPPSSLPRSTSPSGSRRRASRATSPARVASTQWC